MALLTLNSIYKQKGSDFIEELFKSYVIVSEQIDGSRFMFQKHFDDSLIFYKKTGVQISHVDRTLMSFYERGINYISNLSSDILDRIPDNWTFGFKYFPSLAPINIVYDKLPKNNLILTDISIRNDSGRVVKVINDSKVLRDWANILDVELPPIIYEGYLKDEQKEKINKFLNSNEQDLDALFKAESFTRYIISILNPKLKTTALCNSIDKDIEGVVFKFIKPGESEFFTAKIVDPIFQYNIKQNKAKNPRTSNDMYQIAMLDVVEFMEQFKIEKVLLTSESQEERYVELISELFNEYVAMHGHKYVGVDFEVPEFAKSPEFNINKNNIKNARTKEILDNDHMINLYKIILSSFRSHRKKSTDILTDTVTNSINDTVDRIENTIMEKNINNDKVLDFNTFIKKHKYASEGSMFESKQLNEALTIIHPEQGLTKVNFVAGRYQPFTLGHIKVFEQLHKKNGYPVVVCIVRSGKTNMDKNPFSEDTQLKMFAALSRQYKFLESAFVIKSAGIDQIFNSLRPTYEPATWGAGTDRVKAYTYQIDRYSEELKALPELSVHETKRDNSDISATSVRNSLLIEDESTFKKMTPKSIHKFYNELKEEIGVQSVANESFDNTINESVLKSKMQLSLFSEGVVNLIEDWKSYCRDVINEDIDSALDRLKTAVAIIEIPDKKAEVKIVNQITDTAEYIENFKPISDIHKVFVEEKGFSEKDFTRIVNILKKDSEDSLMNLSKYLENPYNINYFTNFNSPTDLAGSMSKDINVSKSTLEYILTMDGSMKGGKGVGRGELFLGLMIKGATNASVGDVNVNGAPYEVKGNQARLNTQNGFGNGNAAIISFMAKLEKIDITLAKKYEIKNKKDVASFNFLRTENRLFDILQDSGENQMKVIDAATDGIFCGSSGIWPNSDNSIRKKVKDALTDFAKNKNYSNARDIFNYTMMYNNILYYQSQEYFNGLFLIQPKDGSFVYFDVSKDDVKWLMKNTKYTHPSFQDNPTSNCWKITVK